MATKCKHCGRIIWREDGEWRHENKRIKHKPEPYNDNPPKTRKPNDFEFIPIHSDAGGYGIEWTCPDCGEKVIWGPYRWWRMECNCRDWDVRVVIKGNLKEDWDV